MDPDKGEICKITEGLNVFSQRAECLLPSKVFTCRNFFTLAPVKLYRFGKFVCLLILVSLTFSKAKTSLPCKPWR